MMVSTFASVTPYVSVPVHRHSWITSEAGEARVTRRKHCTNFTVLNNGARVRHCALDQSLCESHTLSLVLCTLWDSIDIIVTVGCSNLSWPFMYETAMPLGRSTVSCFS